MAASRKPSNKVTLDLCSSEKMTESIVLKINLDSHLVDLLKRINKNKPTKNKNWACVAAILFTEAMREAMIDYAHDNFKGNTNTSSNFMN
jgi:hypothetical protein